MLHLIVAINNKNQIGFKDKLLYRNSIDMIFFKNITTNTISNKINAVIMGRKTWESIPKKFRPLQNRINIILTTQKNFSIDNNNNNIWIRNDFNSTIDECINSSNIDNIFIIGGNSLYNLALQSNQLSSLYITKINHEYSIIDDNIIDIPEIKLNDFNKKYEEKHENEIGVLDINTMKYNKQIVQFSINHYSNDK